LRTRHARDDREPAVPLHRCDELRAFSEFVDENPEFRFELVAASRDLSNAVFRRLG